MCFSILFMSAKISSYKCNLFYSKDSVIKYDAKVLIMATSGGLTDVTLKDVFSCFTGAETMPSFGFDSSGGLNFDKVAQFPTASTCAIQLTLPTMYFDQPRTLKEKCSYAFQNHGGFGQL